MNTRKFTSTKEIYNYIADQIEKCHLEGSEEVASVMNGDLDLIILKYPGLFIQLEVYEPVEGETRRLSPQKHAYGSIIGAKLGEQQFREGTEDPKLIPVSLPSLNKIDDDVHTDLINGNRELSDKWISFLRLMASDSVVLSEARDWALCNLKGEEVAHRFYDVSGILYTFYKKNGVISLTTNHLETGVWETEDLEESVCQ